MTEQEIIAMAMERGGTIGPSVAETMTSCPQAAPVLAPDISEKDFMAKVVEYAESRGFLVYHTHDSRKSAAGFPDLCMVRGIWPETARVLWAELKSETGKMTLAQKDWQKALELAGQEWHIWRPSDWDAILKILA